MQFGYCYHIHDHHCVDLLIWVTSTWVIQRFFYISFEVPNRNIAILLAAEQYFIKPIPSHTIDFLGELMLHKLLLIVRLCRQSKAHTRAIPPAPHKPITSGRHQQPILLLIDIEHIQHPNACRDHQLFFLDFDLAVFVLLDHRHAYY